MTDLRALAPAVIKKKQYLLLSLIAGVLVVVACVVVFMDESSNKTAAAESKPKSGKRIEISKIANGVDASHRWVDISESAQKELGQKLQAQEAVNKDLEAKVAELSDIVKKYEERQDSASLDMLAAEQGRVREELEVLRRGNEISDGGQQNHVVESLEHTQTRKIQNIVIKLDGEESTCKHRSYNLDNYLPPASYAPAVVISGVDASVGVMAQADPRQMVFRIIGKARTAAFGGKPLEVDIIGCTVIAGTGADLSSEKVYPRTVQMTCSREDGKVFVTTIRGYISDLGKAGIRGDIISREGDLVMKSLLAGALGSAGNGVAQRFATPLALPSGLVTQQPGAMDIVNSSVGSGIASASNQISNYFLKTAEQYQPIVSVPAGIGVEVVFQEGTYLGGERDEDEKITAKQ